MSELGNMIKVLRKGQSQKDVGDACGLSERTVQRVETGNDVHLDSVRALATYFKLSKAERAALLIAWIRLQLGEDFDLVEVRSRVGGKAPALTNADVLLEHFKTVPAKLQRELIRAVQRKEVLRSIVPLNELYDKLSGQ